MKKFACIFMVAIMLLAIIPGAVSSQETDADPFLEQTDRLAIDGTDMFWDCQQAISELYPGLNGSNLAEALNPYDLDAAPDYVGQQVNFWIQYGPDASHVDLWKTVAATCRAVGDYCYVYVEDAEWGTHITQAEVDEVMNTFDDTIYPIESENFRELPDYKGQDKVTILLTDIVDGWGTGDPVQTEYIAGYFHSLNYTDDVHSNDRHLINIDTYPGIYYNGVADISNALGTVAHEYQHLLHFWSDPDETTWLNEGQSDYAEFLTLGILEDVHLGFFYEFHSADLEQWGSGDASVIESYGASLSFMMYLYENFGGAELMSAIHNDPLNGRSSINAQVTSASFEDIYTDWTLANFIDNPYIPGPNTGAGLGFLSYDIGSDDTLGQTVLTYHWPNGFNMDGGPFPYADPFYALEEGYPSPDSNYWAGTQQQLDANYFVYEADDMPSIFDITFLGNGHDMADFQIAVPSVGELEWYSQSGNGWYDGEEHTLTYTFDFSSFTTNTYMDIDTWFDIESGWDFGYVEVSTDGGTTWGQLQDMDSVMSTDRDPDAYIGTPGAYAFSGDSSGWVYNVTFDLTAYNGQSEVMVRFNYMTDDGTAQSGWIVDNIRVYNAGTILLDGSDSDDATGVSYGWVHTDTIFLLEWSLYCVGVQSNGVVSSNDIYEVPIDPVTGDGFLQIPGLGAVYDYIVVIPSLVTAENIGGHFLYAHCGDISYSPSSSGAVAATFLIFKNAQSNIIDELDKALYLYDMAERNGYDVSDLDELFDSVNSDVSMANSGVNWVFRAGKLMNAMDTLGTIVDRLILIMD